MFLVLRCMPFIFPCYSKYNANILLIQGKGSTCAFCESILKYHGLKTGFYSSPHLIEVRERIRINGIPLSKEDFAKYFWEVYIPLKTDMVFLSLLFSWDYNFLHFHHCVLGWWMWYACLLQIYDHYGIFCLFERKSRCGYFWSWNRWTLWLH